MHPFTETFRKVVELVGPSVVSIRAEKDDKHVNPYRKDHEPGFFGEGLDVPAPGPHPPGGQGSHPDDFDFPKHAQGSGMIIDTEGHILTNYHVVEGFEEDVITVITHDGQEHEARLVGLDTKTDLGILKMEGKGFQPVEFGNAEDIHVGDWVIAIGNPFGYQDTVSAGIVSGVGRKDVFPFARPFSYEDFIQTDAAINPGNSGGPLVNLRGEVIGISTAIATRNGGFEGIGFAISIEIAKEVIKDLVEKGRVVRGYLGVGIRNIDDELAQMLGESNQEGFIRKYGLISSEGAFVSEVWDDTPASKAGIRPGDIIIMINKEKVVDSDTMQGYIRRTHVEDIVNVAIMRDKNKIMLPIRIEEQPEDLNDRKFLSISIARYGEPQAGSMD